MASRTPKNVLDFDRSSSKNGQIIKTPLTQRRYTPYTRSNQRTQDLTRTPLPNPQQERPTKTQDQPKNRQRSQQPSNEKTEEISSRIVNRSWRIYRVSPLYCLKTDAKSFKAYEKGLNGFLAVENCGVAELQSRTKRKASFRRLEGDADTDYGVEIKITTDEGKENDAKEELVAILCCAGSINNNDNNLKEDLTSLPLCLIKSPVLLMESFLQWIENQFGCKASQLLFSPCDLAWMVSLCAGIGEPTTSIELTYTVPAIIPELDTIFFKMDAKDARRIWNVVHDPKKPYFTNDEANRMLKSIEAHFYHHFKIPLNQMQLTTIATSVAYIGQDGRVKILQEPSVCYILQQLSQLAKV
jgi:centromere protein L